MELHLYYKMRMARNIPIKTLAAEMRIATIYIYLFIQI